MMNVRHAVAAAMICTAAAYSSLYAQQANVQIEGRVLDAATGKPVGCKIDVFNPAGKKIQPLKSNDADGTYLMVLTESGAMKLVFRGHNVYRTEEILQVPATDKFKIIKQDFKIRALYEGTTLFSNRGFATNGATLTNEGRAALETIKNDLRDNGEMRVVFAVAPDEDQVGAARAKAEDQYQRELAEWKKATKKIKKGQTPPAEPVRAGDIADPNIKLVQDRIAAIKAMLADVKNGDLRIQYKEQPLPASAVVHAAASTTAAHEAVTPVADKKGKKGTKQSSTPVTTAQTMTRTAGTSHPTLVCTVGKVKNLFD